MLPHLHLSVNLIRKPQSTSTRKNNDGVHEEKDTLAEVKKLKEEYRANELSERLRKAISINGQLLKLEEANLLIEKQVQQVNAKSEETCEELKSSLHGKKLLRKHQELLQNFSPSGLGRAGANLHP